jgi:hypothetical protein
MVGDPRLEDEMVREGEIDPLCGLLLMSPQRRAPREGLIAGEGEVRHRLK